MLMKLIAIIIYICNPTITNILYRIFDYEQSRITTEDERGY